MLAFIKKFLLWIIGAIVVIAVLVGLVLFAWWLNLPALTLVLILSGITAIIALYFAIRRIRIWLNKRQYIRQMLTTAPVEEQVVPIEHNKMIRAFDKGLSILKKSPQNRSKLQPVYNQPWALMLGKSNPHSIIENLTSAKIPASEMKEPLRWHFLHDLVVLELDSSMLVSSGLELQNAQNFEYWEDVLTKIVDERKNEPINALIINISAVDLYPKAWNNQPFGMLNQSQKPVLSQEQEHAIRDYALSLRSRIEQIMNVLAARLPIYVLVNGIDALYGMDTLPIRLTHSIKDQLLGSVFEDTLFDKEAQSSYQANNGVIYAHKAIKSAQNVMEQCIENEAVIGNFPRKNELYAPSVFSKLEAGLGIFIENLLHSLPHSQNPILRVIAFTCTANHTEALQSLTEQSSAHLSLTPKKSPQIQMMGQSGNDFISNVGEATPINAPISTPLSAQNLASNAVGNVVGNAVSSPVQNLSLMSAPLSLNPQGAQEQKIGDSATVNTTGANAIGVKEGVNQGITEKKSALQTTHNFDSSIYSVSSLPQQLSSPCFIAELFNSIIPKDRFLYKLNIKSRTKKIWVIPAFSGYYLLLFVFCGILAMSSLHNLQVFEDMDKKAPELYFMPATTNASLQALQENYQKILYLEDAEDNWLLPYFGVNSINVELEKRKQDFKKNMRQNALTTVLNEIRNYTAQPSDLATSAKTTATTNDASQATNNTQNSASTTQIASSSTDKNTATDTGNDTANKTGDTNSDTATESTDMTIASSHTSNTDTQSTQASDTNTSNTTTQTTDKQTTDKQTTDKQVTGTQTAGRQTTRTANAPASPPKPDPVPAIVPALGSVADSPYFEMQKLHWMQQAITERIENGKTKSIREVPFPQNTNGSKEVWNINFGELYLAFVDYSSVESLQAVEKRIATDAKLLFATYGYDLLAEIEYEVNAKMYDAQISIASFWSTIPAGSKYYTTVPASYTKKGFDYIKKHFEEILKLTGQTDIDLQTYPSWRQYLEYYAQVWTDFAMQTDFAWNDITRASTLVNMAGVDKIYENPYIRLFQTMAENLAPLKDTNTTDWIEDVFLMNALLEVSKLVGDSDPNSFLATPTLILKTLKNSPENLKVLQKTVLETESPSYLVDLIDSLAQYFKALVAIEQTLKNSTASFELAKIQFGGDTYGNVAESNFTVAKNSLLKSFAFTSTSHNMDNFDSLENQNPATFLLDGPCRYLAHTLTIVAAKELQARWDASIVPAVAVIPQDQLTTVLFSEEGGLITDFINLEASAFLQRFYGYYDPQVFDNNYFPFTMNFLTFIQDGQEAVYKQPQDSYTVKINSQTGSINADAKEHLQYTELTLSCQDQNYTLRNSNYPQNATFQYTPKTCGATTLTFSFPSITFTHSYANFEAFLQDFAYGEKEFVPSDFPSVQTQLEDLAIRRITVRMLPENAGSILDVVNSLSPLPARICGVW